MRQHRPLSPTLEIFDDGANRVRPRVIGIYAVLITANLLAWAGAFASFHGYPQLLASALIAYGLGLRHAVYADHIAAIDNVTRKMMPEDKRPITARSFFLGHSTVVIVVSILIAVAASTLQQRFPDLIETAAWSAP